MTITPGQRLPELSLKIVSNGAAADTTTAQLFDGKKVAVFGVPGAFTPTCHSQHLPGYLQHAAAFRAKGADAIVCLTVNDRFVVAEWAKATGSAADLVFIADGSAEFTRALGLDKDFGASGMGVRAARFSMLVDNGVVTALNVETKSGVDVSSAETLLSAL
jgi:glutaredoxin/glutathione-dependent peroxiredoxin